MTGSASSADTAAAGFTHRQILVIMSGLMGGMLLAALEGYFMAVFATSSVVGPVLGGLFAGADSIVGIAGWRWVFLVNVPVGLVAFAIVFRVLRLPTVFHPSVRIDWFGAVAMAVGLVPLLVVAEQGREWGWSSPKAWTCYVVGALGLLGFVAIEARMRESALIPLRIFRNSTFSIGIGISIVVGAAMFGGIVLIPQYLQVVRGSSPTLAGLQMLPLVAGLMVASITSGRLIARTGRYRIFPLVGSVLLMLGAYLLHFVTAVTPMWVVMAFMAIAALANGLVGNDPSAAQHVLTDSSIVQQLSPALARPFQDGFADSMSTVFLVVTGVAAVALILVLFWTEVPLRTKGAAGPRGGGA